MQTILVQTRSPIPVSRQIAEQLRQLIVDGALTPGTPLPSVREYADQLGVSRSTVSRAVEELASQGYVIAEQGSGTRVADRLPGELPDLFKPRAQALPAVKRDVQLSSFGNRLMSNGFTTQDLSTLVQGRPVLQEGLLKVWKDLLHRHSRLNDASQQEYVLEPFGYEPLREAYASYLIRARAVRASKEQVAVFNAKELRIDMVCRLLLKAGDVVALEDPGYVTGRKQYQVNGARVLPIPVDKDGIIVDELINSTEKIKLVHVTPSHHSPTGAVLSLDRREKLLRWAKQNNVYIVEDDYDSEFRYDGRPLPSLQGMDDGENVIYISCLWRLISPVCRLGFITVPPSLVSAFRAVKALFERDVCLIDQLVLTDFINEGHLERSIRRLRGVYAARREAAVNRLKDCFGQAVDLATEASGLELLVRFRGDVFSDQAIEEAAKLSNLTVYSTAPYYINARRGHEFVLAFAQYSEGELEERLQAFAGHLSRRPFIGEAVGSGQLLPAVAAVSPVAPAMAIQGLSSLTVAEAAYPVAAVEDMSPQAQIQATSEVAASAPGPVVQTAAETEAPVLEQTAPAYAPAPTPAPALPSFSS